MSLDDLARLGESAGIFAVLITLIYLAVQVRQHNREVRDQTAWRIHEAFQGFGDMLVQPDMFDVWCRGNDDFGSLDREDRERHVILVATWHNILMALHRTKDTSAVPAEYWEHAIDTFSIYYSQYPGFSEALALVNVPDYLLREIELRAKEEPSRPTTAGTPSGQIDTTTEAT